MNSNKIQTLACALIPMALALVSCGGGGYGDVEYLNGMMDPAQTKSQRDVTSYWDGEAASGASSIRINLTEQRAYFYKSGQLVGVSEVSTGREGYQTPAGSFKILQKNADHRSNLYGDYVDSAGNVVMRDIGIKTHKKPPGARFLGAPMPYFMRLTNTGVGMHAGYLPGVPDSHGCIRMPEHMAQVFYQNVSKGTPVRVEY